jgi:hypothetical protein
VKWCCWDPLSGCRSTSRACRLNSGRAIQKAHAPMVPRQLARHRHLAAADQPRIGNGLVGGATRPGGDDGAADASAAGDAVDAGGVEGLGQGHVGEDRRQAPGQHRFPRPRRPEEQDVGVRTPAYISISLASPSIMMARRKRK